MKFPDWEKITHEGLRLGRFRNCKFLDENLSEL